MIQLTRYPLTNDTALQAWNAADELILTYLEDNDISTHHPILLNDRFGYLTCHLINYEPQVVSLYKSQEKSISKNLAQNQLRALSFLNPLLETAIPSDLGIIKIPKSLDLFRLLLHQLHEKLSEDGTVVCGFMTKYFTPQLIKIAEEYFDKVEQSKALKKARLMILSGKKKLPQLNIIEKFEWNNNTYSQYLGVFSSGHIDYATQFFLEELAIKATDKNSLDLASGNGVIARFIREQKPDASIRLIDDSWLAIASSKLNLTTGENHFHFNDSLDDIEDQSLDLVVSNPPFHFDFETNLDITFSLFSQVEQKLRSGGRFELVANRHLPYKPYLDKLFDQVVVLKQNQHFIIYSCFK